MRLKMGLGICTENVLIDTDFHLHARRGKFDLIHSNNTAVFSGGNMNVAITSSIHRMHASLRSADEEIKNLRTMYSAT
jgi:hypothetical protein